MAAKIRAIIITMDATLEDIEEFLYERLHDSCCVERNSIQPDSDLFYDLGVDGDDWDELLPAFSKRFGVDLSGFLWYFHHGEEGLNPLSLMFPPPNARVEHIPITPRVLLDSARTGKWSVAYPAHKLPRWRPDVLALWTLIAVAALGGVAFWLVQHAAHY